MEDQRHLVLDGPCSWPVFCFFFGMHVSAPDRICQIGSARLLDCAGFLGAIPQIWEPSA